MVCPIEVELGEEWHPVTVALMGNLAPATLSGGTYQYLPVDGGMDFTIQPAWPVSAPDTLYLSWPRLEVEDAGLRLIVAWSEAIVPAGNFVRFRVEQTSGLLPTLPNAVLIDGNTISGTFVYRLVE